MGKCPVCGGRLTIAKRETKYKGDWNPFTKTKRIQKTYMVCQNTNFKNKEIILEEEHDGKMYKIPHQVPVPCPMYCGRDLGNPQKVVEVIEAETE